MKKAYVSFIIIALILSHAACALIAYAWCALEWAERYEGASAPPSVALIYAVPFAAAIALCIVLALYFKKKSK